MLSNINITERIIIMKKILSLILVFVAVMTLFCSCGDNKPGESKPIEAAEYTYVILEDNTAKITKYNGTTNVVELDIPSSFEDVTVTVIGAEAFLGVQTITVVNFPDTITKIEESAFKGSSIKKAFMHRSSITDIGAYAFSECKNLVQTDMPATLTTLGERAYHYCDNLKVATFRGDTANIDKFAFDACPKVKLYVKDTMQNVISFANTYNLELDIAEK